MSFILSLILAFLVQVIIYSTLLLYRPKHTSKINKGSKLMGSLNIILLVMIIMLWLIYVMKLISLFSFSITISIIVSLILYFHVYSSYASKVSSKVLLYSLTLLISLSTLVMLGNTYPTIEEGRYLGFARNVIAEGHWIPFTFADNDYYQFFHIAANYLALVLIISGMNPFILRKVLSLAVTFFLMILAVLISRKVGKSSLAGVSPIFLVTSPMLVVLYMVYGNGPLGMLLAVFTMAIAILFFNDQRMLLLVPLISVTGVLTHGVYSIYVVPFLMLLYVVSRNNSNARKIYALSLIMVTVITLSYWVFSVILKSIVVKVVSDYLRELSRIITQPFEARPGYTPWYAYLNPVNRILLAISWAFVLSIAFSSIVQGLIERAKANGITRGIESMLGDKAVLLALLSFTFLGVSLLWYLATRTTTMGLGFGHFYGLAFLCIPLASRALSEIVTKHKVTLLLNLVIMSLVVYGAMQDPHYNVSSPALGIASERDWVIGVTLRELKEPGIAGAGDFRLASPSLYQAAIRGELKYQLPSQSYEREYLVTFTLDAKGIACIERSLFFQKHPVIGELILTGEYPYYTAILFNDGFYKSILISLK